LHASTSSIIDRFPNLFHCQIQENILLILSLNIRCAATLPCEMSCSNNWKQDDFCDNTF